MQDTQPQSAPAIEPGIFARAHVRLAGTVDYMMYQRFRDQIEAAPLDGPVVIEVSTLGGDPEVARMMASDVRLLSEMEGRQFLFLGKAAVYSAGATFMAGFPVRHRWLTKQTRIMIHERKMNKTMNVEGPLETCIASLKATLHEIEESIKIEREGFCDLIEGSKIDYAELIRRAPENWYIEAQEALALELVAGVI